MPNHVINRIEFDCSKERLNEIYRYLRYRQGKKASCYQSHKTIARDNSCSVSTVRRAIDELVKKGYVEKINRRRPNGSKTSNMYICK